jgi:hypothetical protein
MTKHIPGMGNIHVMKSETKSYQGIGHRRELRPWTGESHCLVRKAGYMSDEVAAAIARKTNILQLMEQRITQRKTSQHLNTM